MTHWYPKKLSASNVYTEYPSLLTLHDFFYYYFFFIHLNQLGILTSFKSTTLESFMPSMYFFMFAVPWASSIQLNHSSFFYLFTYQFLFVCFLPKKKKSCFI